MAKSKTPIKRARQNEENRLRNKAYKTRLKTAQNRYEASLKESDIEVAKDNLLQLTSIIDKSVSKGVLHKNAAAHKKSSNAKKLQTISQ